MYEYILVHKTSSTHCNADALSRLPIPETIPTTPQPAEIVLLMEQMQDSPVTADHIRLWTRRDPLLSRVMQYVMNGWPNGTVEEHLRPYWQKRLELSCQDGCLLWGSRVIVPPKGRANVLEELHMAHPGATRMKRIARTLVWWPGLDKEIEQQVHSCVECQINLPAPPSSPLQPWRWPTRPWTRLHADFAGPFLGSMFLVVVDAHSKWIEVHSLPSITAATTIQCFRRIFATFGLPEVIVTDNGSTFTSGEFQQFLRRNGIKHKRSPPYHPATNGLAERAVQTFKRGKKRLKLKDFQVHFCILEYSSKHH